jgi:hypothetical protein
MNQVKLNANNFYNSSSESDNESNDGSDNENHKTSTNSSDVVLWNNNAKYMLVGEFLTRVVLRVTTVDIEIDFGGENMENYLSGFGSLGVHDKTPAERSAAELECNTNLHDGKFTIRSSNNEGFTAAELIYAYIKYNGIDVYGIDYVEFDRMLYCKEENCIKMETSN